jgi:hypothetical protein
LQTGNITFYQAHHPSTQINFAAFEESLILALLFDRVGSMDCSLSPLPTVFTTRYLPELSEMM